MSHGGDPDFQKEFFGDHAEEFHDTIQDVLSEWGLVADDVPGRYQALAPDNLPMVLADGAGLRALEEQLRSATEAIDAIVSTT